ncbi:hydroxymethylbilane synthase [Lacipirellula limnantheis]|uniref:Porphobilinogen deaminase n=1 Tax=Lacipirellula limnantheis TaxID=2528024 RepID=A0A517TV88_9BACT|nr:hydroxymethylbilane synthase [Lacipirellula limnantheis]QDT72293.1 Porphobilinogen deaminase [Lacipirellula limnantheis]
MPLDRPLRIGTRASKLARWQSDWVAAELSRLGAAVEIVEITTRGDVEQLGPVGSIGTQGVFTKEIQAALLAGQVDLAVHSLKDLPTEQVAGLVLAATPPRESVADALVARSAASLADLPPGARVGTGSLRRRAQLLHLRPDLHVAGIRGNVDTRLRKLDDGEFDAIVLAAAGLTRLGWAARITDRLEPPRMLPAPGQGSLALECRADDLPTLEMVAHLNDPLTRLGVVAERAVLAALHGGCSAPIAAWGRVDRQTLRIDGLVASLDGREVVRSAIVAELPAGEPGDAVAAAEQAGLAVADELRMLGAEAIILAAKQG